MGSNALSYCQFGKETDNGTAVAADTKLLMKMPAMTPDRTIEVIEENIGVRAKGVRSRVGQVIAVTDTLPFADAYFQMLPMLLSCGLKGDITPAEQNGGEGDYLWSFAPSMTATNSIDSITLERYDGIDCLETEYVMFEGYRIQASIAQQQGSAPVTIEGQFFGRQNTKDTVTAAIAIPSVTNINGKLFNMYRDTAWASVGNTEVANILRGFDLQIFTGVHPEFMGSGNRYFNTHAEGLIDFTCSFELEGNAAADDIYDLAQAGTLSVVRLEVEGPQIGSGDNHKLSLDMGGVWSEPTKISSVANMDNLFSATLKGKYDITGAKVFQAAVTTNVASI